MIAAHRLGMHHLLNMTENIVLFGVESIFSAEVAETAMRLHRTVHAGILTDEPEWDLAGIERTIRITELDDRILSMALVVPWVTPAGRRALTRRAEEAGFHEFDSLIDPSSVVASSARLGPGVFLNAGVVVGAHAVLEPHVLVNRNVSVGHHSVLDEFVSTGPGASIAGRCRIGAGAMIGTGAAIAPGVTIGAGSVVGVGAGVMRDVPEGAAVIGNPARVVKRRDGH